jgi:hypothetical protein
MILRHRRGDVSSFTSQVARKYHIHAEDLLHDIQELPAPFFRLFRSINGLATLDLNGLKASTFLAVYPVLRDACLMNISSAHVEMAFALLKRYLP